MKAGVSTACLYPRLLEDSLYDLALNGVPHVEIFVNTHSELNKVFAQSLAETMKHFDVSCRSVHPFTCEIEPLMLFSDYPRRMNDITDYYKRFFSFMNIVGAEIFVLHGHKGGPSASREMFCERYTNLRNIGKEFGVNVALENVSRCLSGSLSFAKEISKMLGDDISFVLDTKQAVRAKENPFDFVKALGGKIAHVHISDSGEKGDCLLIGKGRFNVKKFLAELYGQSPECSVILELYKGGFSGISDLVNNYNVLDNMIKGLEK